jgi:phage/plasmid-associated DNA primase
MKRYDDVDIFPPPLECPPNMFNLWTPFRGQILKDKGYTLSKEAIDMVNKHLLTMCDNDEKVSYYSKVWIGQMLKYPAIKTNVPIFTGNQGSGKTSIFNMLRAILGDDKVFETTSPEKDIWGTYNGVLANCFLVVINELEKQQMSGDLGKIKGLITETALTINTKCVAQYQINSYHRFGMTTNKEDPAPTSKDDRRFWIVRVCDMLIGNKEYFDKFYAMLKDDNCIATLYDYFYNLEGVDDFNNLPKPTTQYQEILVGINTDIVDDFWKQFSQDHYYDADKVFEEHCSVLYSQFKQFCKERGCEFIHSNRKFFGSTATKRIKGITDGQRTNKGYKKRFDINELVSHYGVVCDAKEEDTDDECETD